MGANGRPGPLNRRASVLIPADQDLALAGVVGGADDAFFFHALDERGRLVVADGETALDVVAYGAHMAALLGAHIIKVKPPTAHIAQPEAKAAYAGGDFNRLKARVAHVVQAAFCGRRIVLFSGGPVRNDRALLDEIEEIHLGGAHGSIVGRNAFQRPYRDALTLLQNIIDIHLDGGA